MMKNTDVIMALAFGLGLFVFLVVLVVLIRTLIISRFQRKCRALGFRPSPRDSFFCLGSWQDARVVIERCGTKYCNTIYVYMDLGALPPGAERGIGHFMGGLQTDYYTIGGDVEKRGLEKIVAGEWRAPFLYSAHLPLNATPLHIKQLCEALYQIRTELRRRVFSAGQGR